MKNWIKNINPLFWIPITLTLILIVGSAVGYYKTYSTSEENLSAGDGVGLGDLPVFQVLSRKILPRISTWDFGIGSNTATSSADFAVDPGNNTITINTILYTFPTDDGNASQFLQTNGSGTLTWATAAGGGGGTQIELQNSFVDLGSFSSLSFDAGHFTVTDTTGEATVKLDWTNGPASRSANETITGLWKFTAASNQFSNTLEIGTASVGGNLYVGGNAGIGHLTPANKLDVNGSLALATSGFLGFVGNAAVTTSNYSLFGNTTLTLVNARAGGSIGFRIANTDVANFSTTGGFGFGSTYYNLDPGQNNMTVEGNLGIGVSAPTTKLDVGGSASISSNFEVDGLASASKYFGGGLKAMSGTDGCSAAGDTLNYTASTGLFSCGSDASGGGSSFFLDVGDSGGVYHQTSSISFDAGHFTTTYGSPIGSGSYVRLDWGSGGPASLSQAETITGLWTFSGGASFSGAVTGTIDELLTFGATSAVLPSASFATFDTRNDFTVLDFGDGAVASKSIFIGVMPRDYDDGTITIVIHFAATSATSGNAFWSVEFDRVGTALDTDSATWATAQTNTCAVSGTAGILSTCSITFTQAQADGVLKGELFRMRVVRDVTNAADTVTATDLEFHYVEIIQ